MNRPASLAALHQLCFVTPRPWSAPEFAALLEDPGVFCKTRPDGFCMGRLLLDEVELLTLAIAPAARRRGLGAMLLAEFEAQAQDGGATQAFLEVAADNTPAKRLYARSGYAQVGLRRNYYRAPDGGKIDAEILRKGLAPR